MASEERVLSMEKILLQSSEAMIRSFLMTLGSQTTLQSHFREFFQKATREGRIRAGVRGAH